MEKQKLQDAELQRITQLRTDLSNLVIRVGQNRMEAMNLNRSLAKADSEYNDLKNAHARLLDVEQALNDELFQRYGNVQIDLESGTIG
jgi:septal ring factor EnvC (AmiA/AmiB activator)